MANKKLFLSYSRRDTEYVSSLVESLRKQGFDVWFDKNIRTGTDWDSTIEEEIKKADALVLVLSQTSVDSDNVKDEMSYAIGLGKEVIPIKIEECDVPMRLGRKQFVDFTLMGHEAGFERLVKDLNIRLNEMETAVPKGAFKPPINTKTANVPAKGTKKLVPYIIGGVVSMILLILIAMNCGGETETNDYASEDITNQDWQTAINANTINSYLGYIKDYGSRDTYYRAAQDSIDALMVYEGMVIYGDVAQRYFVKNLYTDMNGDLVNDQDDDQIPKKGDIITALVPVQLYDSDTFEPMEDTMLEPGEKARVVSVRTDKEQNVFIILHYPEM